MRITFLVIFIAALLHMGTGESQATALAGPQCDVKAEILEVGHEMRVMDDQSVRDFPYVKFKVLMTIGNNPTGSCAGVAKGDIFSTDGGSDPVGLLKQGDIVSMGVEKASAMTPQGSSTFLQWQPIKLIEEGEGKQLPASFHLQSIAKPISSKK